MNTLGQYKEFTSKDLIVLPDAGKLSYRRRTGESKINLHWGQRKLLMSEIEFLTIYWDQQKIPNPLCVYAGAAEGTHIPFLSEMFPSFEFHLYDMRPFNIDQEVLDKGRIKLFSGDVEGMFTDEVAKRYAGRDDVFFVSDIRSSDHKKHLSDAFEKRGLRVPENMKGYSGISPREKEAVKEARRNNEKGIWGDMEWQQSWVMIMNPVHALLKFRLPYPEEGEEEIKKYLKGVVYWGIWRGQTSTEGRLMPVKNRNGAYEVGTWSSLEYESMCFYHNVIVRETFKYINVLTGAKTPIDPPELTNDFDSSAEAFLLKMYLEKHSGFDVRRIAAEVPALSKLITLTLNPGNKNTRDRLYASLSKRRADAISGVYRKKIADRERREVFRGRANPIVARSTPAALAAPVVPTSQRSARESLSAANWADQDEEELGIPSPTKKRSPAVKTLQTEEPLRAASPPKRPLGRRRAPNKSAANVLGDL